MNTQEELEELYSGMCKNCMHRRSLHVDFYGCAGLTDNADYYGQIRMCRCDKFVMKSPLEIAVQIENALNMREEK